MRHGGEQLKIPPNSYLCLEHVDLLDCAGVCLPDDRDDVDLLVDLLHHLNIQRLQEYYPGGALIIKAVLIEKF